MIVNKTCVLNSVEPSPLSFRAPMGLDTSLNVVFYGQDGQPYPSDLGAQLQLTGRSTARTSTYFMPATDIANGRARAVIPGGDISDVNGYRLRIVGTWKGEPALLALGTLATVAAAGLETVPEDVIDTIDLNLTYGNPVTMIVKLWQDAGKNIPYDLSVVTVSASILAAQGGSALQPFTIDGIAGNAVTLSLTAVQVDTLPAACWWDLVVSSSAGATTLAQGNVTVRAP